MVQKPHQPIAKTAEKSVLGKLKSNGWKINTALFFLAMFLLGFFLVWIAKNFLKDEGYCDVCKDADDSKYQEARAFSDDPMHRTYHSKGHPASSSPDAIPRSLRGPCYCSTKRKLVIALFADRALCEAKGIADEEACKKSAAKVVEDVSAMIYEPQLNLRLEPKVFTAEMAEAEFGVAETSFLAWSCEKLQESDDAPEDRVGSEAGNTTNTTTTNPSGSSNTTAPPSDTTVPPTTTKPTGPVISVDPGATLSKGESISKQLHLTGSLCPAVKSKYPDVGLCVLLTGCVNLVNGKPPARSTTYGISGLGVVCSQSTASSSVVIDSIAHEDVGKSAASTFMTMAHEIGHAFGGDHAGSFGTGFYGNSKCKKNNCGVLGSGYVGDGEYYGFARETLTEMCDKLYTESWGGKGVTCLKGIDGATIAEETCPYDPEAKPAFETVNEMGIAFIIIPIVVAVLTFLLYCYCRKKKENENNTFSEELVGRPNSGAGHDGIFQKIKQFFKSDGKSRKLGYGQEETHINQKAKVGEGTVTIRKVAKGGTKGGALRREDGKEGFKAARKSKGVGKGNNGDGKGDRKHSKKRKKQ